MFYVHSQRKHNDATLTHLQLAASLCGLPRRSLASISRVLKAARFTTKSLVVEPINKNSSGVKAERVEYVEWAREHLTAENSIFLDEASFNSAMARRRGRSERGVKAVARKRALIGTSHSILAAVSPRFGLLSYAIRRKLQPHERGQRTTIAWFCDFIKSLLPRLPPGEKFYFIADNSNQHSAPDVGRMLSAESSPNEFHLLSRYSPNFNPIENCFHVWKAGIKTIENMVPAFLRPAIQVASTRVTPAIVARCYRHVVETEYPRALALQDF